MCACVCVKQRTVFWLPSKHLVYSLTEDPACCAVACGLFISSGLDLAQQGTLIIISWLPRFAASPAFGASLLKVSNGAALFLLSQHFQKHSKAGWCGYLSFLSCLWHKTMDKLWLCFCCSAQNWLSWIGVPVWAAVVSWAVSGITSLISPLIIGWVGGGEAVKPQALWNSAVTLTWQSDHRYSRCCFSPCHKSVLKKSLPFAFFFLAWILSFGPWESAAETPTSYQQGSYRL